eukprot:CAMPEP_0170111118 /NCGR_PEP_ID=MMETSP0020_2-20130122/8288_1 /TAXON_ID=98059 /ORGANISM="Dinobryon sp., Strain UTEXLB2267" /LENGTH=230 /DNA_ID=CAMNT_0010336593 /DNA_START=830 /DNA_END=1519 /DNA_ORIENTATION=-
MDGCVDDNILSCCSGTVRTIPCYSLDNHANVCIFANPFLLENLRDLKRVGDHPIFKTVFVDPRNKYNLVGEPIIRKHGMQITGRSSCASTLITVTASTRLRSPMLRSVMPHLQMERANKVLALHEALCHPSDEALKNAREIHGPCAVCLQSKPLAVTGSNPSYDRHEVPMPVLMDAASGKFSMVRLHNKGSEHLANFRALEQWLNSGGIQYRSRVPYEHEKPCERGMRRV